MAVISTLILIVKCLRIRLKLVGSLTIDSFDFVGAQLFVVHGLLSLSHFLLKWQCLFFVFFQICYHFLIFSVNGSLMKIDYGCSFLTVVPTNELHFEIVTMREMENFRSDLMNFKRNFGREED